MTATAEADKNEKELNVYRDTVESIGVAIILAFVLRAFVVEAFVIPTGSMAPRLMGEHWDLRCPYCGTAFAYGAEANTPQGYAMPPNGSRCPNCRMEYPAGERPDFVSGGDRVLVMKYIYNFIEPQPWDVVVFKNPQDNRDNYIKRLIGLPGETIEIVQGDIFVSNSPDADAPRQIRRKPPKVQEAMWQSLFENDYQVDPKSEAAKTSPRWRPRAGADLWDLKDPNRTEGGRLFAFMGGVSADGPAEIAFEPGGRDVFSPHYGYNVPSFEREGIEDDAVCSDLKLSAIHTPTSEKPGAVTLKFTRFDFAFEAEFRTDGAVTLTCRSPDLPGPDHEIRQVGQAPPAGPGRGRLIALTHVDFRAAAWVDGQCVVQTPDDKYADVLHGEVGRPGCYAWLRERLEKGKAMPIPAVRIAASGGACELNHLAIYRDVYYTAARLSPVEGIPAGPTGDYAREINDAHEKRDVAERHKLDPRDIRHQRVDAGERGKGWGTYGRPIQLAKHPDRPDLDEFYVLGDNSPRSKDSRMWVSAAPALRLYDDDGSFLYQLGTAPRYNLLGRAMFVYWPSGFRVPFLNRLALVPNVGKMRFIR
jgi:signal peptidase I